MPGLTLVLQGLTQVVTNEVIFSSPLTFLFSGDTIEPGATFRQTLPLSYRFSPNKHI